MSESGTLRAKIELTTAIIALLLVIGSVFTAVTKTDKANNTQKENNALQSSASSVSSDLSSAQAHISTAESSLSAANSVIASLGARQSKPPTISNPPPTSQASPAVRHQGLLVLTPDQSGIADLDVEQSDIQWGRVKNTSGDGVLDGPTITPFQSNVDVVNNAQIAFIGSDAASYDKCSHLQTYSQDVITFGQMAKGSNICVETSAGRFARLVLAKDANVSEVDLNVTVWEK